MKLVYKNEEPLFYILLVFSIAAWAIILYASKGAALAIIPVLFLMYVFTHSGFIAHFRGRGALVSATQFPDLDEKLKGAAQLLEMKSIPATYLVNANGVFNAFATKFLRRYYVILNSSIVDALHDKPDAITFYIGHELGHIRRKHLIWQMILAPGMMLPLVGAAYSRAREYTCDLHGAACCKDPASAERALAVLAVGRHRWKDMDIHSYLAQVDETGGFWMSFHELVASYPWLTKRLMHISVDSRGEHPGRNPFAYVLAAFVPRISVTTLIVFYVVYIFLALPHLMKSAEALKAAGHASETQVGRHHFDYDDK